MLREVDFPMFEVLGETRQFCGVNFIIFGPYKYFLEFYIWKRQRGFYVPEDVRKGFRSLSNYGASAAAE